MSWRRMCDAMLGRASRTNWQALAAMSVGSTAAWHLSPHTSRAPEACGIAAYIGKDPAVDYLLEGLVILQNRGYDSAGLATLSNKGEPVTTKYASRGSTSDSIEILKYAFIHRVLFLVIDRVTACFINVSFNAFV